jgi:hypothetical protein
MAARQPSHDPLCVSRDERYSPIPTPLLLPSASVAMPISPVVMMMTSPAPVSTNRSRHLPVSSVPPFDVYGLLPTNLGRSMPWPVIIMVPIAIVVGKNDRRERGQRKKFILFIIFIVCSSLLIENKRLLCFLPLYGLGRKHPSGHPEESAGIWPDILPMSGLCLVIMFYKIK